MNKLQVGLDFQTPPEVCKYMVGLIQPGAKTILEPTPGVGNLVKAVKAGNGGGYEVTAPDDYFLLEKGRWDCIVMNPPFSAKYAILDNAEGDFSKYGMRLGYQILSECMKMTDNVIALMPWFTISDSDVRLRNLKKYGLISITALPRKTFQYARIQTMVLQMQRGFQGETAFKVYDHIVEDSKNQTSLF